MATDRSCPSSRAGQWPASWSHCLSWGLFGQCDLEPMPWSGIPLKTPCCSPWHLPPHATASSSVRVQMRPDVGSCMRLSPRQSTAMIALCPELWSLAWVLSSLLQRPAVPLEDTQGAWLGMGGVSGGLSELGGDRACASCVSPLLQGALVTSGGCLCPPGRGFCIGAASPVTSL